MILLVIYGLVPIPFESALNFTLTKRQIGYTKWIEENEVHFSGIGTRLLWLMSQEYRKLRNIQVRLHIVIYSIYSFQK